LLLLWTDFEWDETKRQANILKHGIDFVDAIGIFAGRFIETEDRRRDYGERRFLASGERAGEIIRVVHTWRGERCRIINARRARRDERSAYYAGIAETGPQDEESN
jgi:uncharacterized DUF497 family protein